jgi:hypothetical protein
MHLGISFDLVYKKIMGETKNLHDQEAISKINYQNVDSCGRVGNSYALLLKNRLPTSTER